MADDDHSKHDPDEVFQILVCARGMRPVDALGEIQTALESDRLRVEYRIRGGATNRSGKAAPPEGLTGPVLFQAWRVGTMYLMIEADHLVIKIQGAIDEYAWEDASFTITNWFLVNELWPPKPPISASSKAPALEALDQSRPDSARPPVNKGGSTGIWDWLGLQSILEKAKKAKGRDVRFESRENFEEWISNNVRRKDGKPCN